MAKVVVSEFVSLDGVVQAPSGEPGYRHTGWVMKFPDPEQLTYKLAEVLAHEALLLVRKHTKALQLRGRRGPASSLTR